MLKAITFWIFLVMLYACSSDVDDNPENINPDAYLIGVVSEVFGKPINAAAIGALYAVEEINAAGGIYGKPLDLVVRNGGCDSETGRFQTEKLVAEFDVVALIGPSCSASAALIVEGVLSQHNLPAIGTTTTSPLLTDLDKDNIFYRLQASDSIIIELFFNEVVNDDVQRLAIIHRGGNDVFNIALADGLAQKFSALANKTLTAQIAYPEESTVEFNEQVQLLFDSGDFDGLAIFGFGPDSANLSIAIEAEMRRRGISRSSIKGVYLNTADSSVQQLGSKVLFDQSKSVEPAPISMATAPDLSAWRQAFNQFSDDDRGENALGYDAMYLIALAMLKAGVNEGDDTANIRQAIKMQLAIVSGSNAATEAVTIRFGEFALALDTVASGGDINYNGASGVIDFDLAGDINYGDFRLQQAEATDDGLVFSCLQSLRLYPTDTGVAIERTACE
ncbi:MAG: ABC transporter substrate-binding protein [Pseudomonadales bacterium]|nr:ABC transporter substrate-binding protein [Pseudomonadales bacterium]